MIEDDLRAHYADIHIDPDAPARLLATLERSPRRPNLRTGLAVSGSVAAVGALAVAVTLIPHTRGTPAASGSTDVSSVTASTTTPTPSSISAPAVQQNVTPQVVVTNLIDLVSDRGTATSPGGRGLDNQSLGNIVFDDGHGAALIDIAVTWKGTAPHDAIPQGCSASPACTVLPGGTTVSVAQGLEYGSGSTHAINATEWTVSAYRVDGLEVDISEWNAAAEKNSPITRPAPPFTIAELTALATSPTWNSVTTPSEIAADNGLFVPDFMPGNDGTTSTSGTAAGTATATH